MKKQIITLAVTGLLLSGVASILNTSPLLPSPTSFMAGK